MEKRRVYLDVDDVVVDTENHLRKVLGGKWLNYKGLVYGSYSSMTEEEMHKVASVFGDYTKIPFIEGAIEGMEILRRGYDVILCSSYSREDEKVSKKVWAEQLGLPLILCKGFTKGNINMSGAVMIDDNTKNLDRTNAEIKICFYKKYNFFSEKSGVTVFNWNSLVTLLSPSENSLVG